MAAMKYVRIIRAAIHIIKMSKNFIGAPHLASEIAFNLLYHKTFVLTSSYLSF